MSYAWRPVGLDAGLSLAHLKLRKRKSGITLGPAEGRFLLTLAWARNNHAIIGAFPTTIKIRFLCLESV